MQSTSEKILGLLEKGVGIRNLQAALGVTFKEIMVAYREKPKKKHKSPLGDKQVQ